jgi:phosphoglycolate phosphatase
MALKVELVIFDLDGTLLDTAPDLYKALRDTLREYGKEAPTFEEFRKHIGGGAFGFLEPFLPPDLLEEALLKLRKHYLEKYLCVETEPFDGIVETLKALKKSGVKLAVATNKITEGANRVLEKTGLIEFFELVVGRDLPPAHKPSPKHLLFISDALGVKPSHSVMVGDRSDDVLAALEGGFLSAYALWGYTEEKLPKKPHFYLKNPKELLNIVGAANLSEVGI